MRLRKSRHIFCAIALLGLIGLWIGSYTVFRSKYGEVSRSGAYESRNTRVRNIHLDDTDDVAGAIANYAGTVYAPLMLIDTWITDIEVNFVVPGRPSLRTPR